MADPTEEDFRWLVDAAARPYLAQATESQSELVRLARHLRKDLSAARVHLVLEQVALRARAREKFSRADKMYFAPRLLEQATDEWIAGYKAQRLALGQVSLDLCCGLGGDLLAWAERGCCRGVDRDPIAALLARANSAALEIAASAVEVADATLAPVEAVHAWHVDPDRRPEGRRTTHLDACQPDRDALDRLLARQPSAAIKLAPATAIPESWCRLAEREWIGSRRECRQQVVWFGSLATHPGQQRATVVDRDAQVHSLIGASRTPVPVTDQLGGYLFEPHAAVLAARLPGVLCELHQLSAFRIESGYLTGSERVDSPLLAAFAVLETLPFDVRRLRGVLRAGNVGRLEIKIRGARVDPGELARTLKLRGTEERTLLLSGPENRPCAVLARRVFGRAGATC
jgi:hypothetical protein